MFRDRFGPSMGNVEISTIDGFQGREKDIVIFSCVRAPASGRGYQSPGRYHRTASLYLLQFSLLQFFVVTIDLMTEVAVFDCDDLVVYVFYYYNTLVCVCVSARAGIGFLKEWQRLNVAITRAKFAVWIVGHAETLGADSEWKHLIDFTKEKK